MITTGTARRRAARGVARARAEYGQDWYRRIDLATLNLSNPSACIIAQLRGSWYLGTHGALSDWHCGFLLFRKRGYPVLQEAWENEIRRRLQADHQLVA
jgi:hypothetical protein